MRAKFKLFFIPLVCIPLLFIVTSCSKTYQVGYYANTNDLYAIDSYNTLKIECKNSRGHDVRITHVDHTHDDDFEENGWKGNTWSLTYNSAESTDFFIDFIIERTLTSEIETIHFHSDANVLLHNRELIDDATIRLIAANKSAVDGSCYRAISTGTAWIVKQVLSGDEYYDNTPGVYQYYLLTDWHVQQMIDKISPNNYYWNNGDNKFNSFKEIKPINSGFYSGEHQNVGSDTYLYYANFGTNGNQKFDDVNNLCDENGYPFKLHNDNDDISTEQFFIGGYPADKKDIKKSSFSYLTCRAYDTYGYANKGWFDQPIELDNISHFLIKKNTWAIGNDIIMEPEVCAKLSSGASGSIVLDSYGALVGIYWGGRMDEKTNAYYGNIETLYPINTTANEAHGEFSNFSLSSLSDGGGENNKHWFKDHLDVPVNEN